jgi:flavin-dependent dehydrogenase
MSDNRAYDVIIVGGGLAGLSLAILLSRRSYSVLVLEKDDYPRHKVCGEYISMESKPFLESLGLPVDAMHLPVMSKLQVTDVKGNAINAPLPQGGFGISRYKLDASLAQLALDAGAEVLTKARVDQVEYEQQQFAVQAKDRVYTARAVCGTWGKRSNMDVKWQRPFLQGGREALNNYVGIKYHVRSHWPEDTIGLHNFSGGYCGISSIEDGKNCLCYLTTAASLQQSGNDIKQMERQLLMRNPVLKRLFRESEFLYEAPLAISQISFQKREQVYDHVLLLGDAAGVITPLCGNGMSMALHAGKIAAEHVDNFLQGRSTLSQMEQAYTTSWKKQFSNRLSVGRVVQTYFGKEKASSFLINTFNHLPFLQKPLINRTSGKVF